MNCIDKTSGVYLVEGAHKNDDKHYKETEFALQLPEVVNNSSVIPVPVQISLDVHAISVLNIDMNIPAHAKNHNDQW
eukprot:6069136-Ditylum_brightwellii.AAC.1